MADCSGLTAAGTGARWAAGMCIVPRWAAGIILRWEALAAVVPSAAATPWVAALAGAGDSKGSAECRPFVFNALSSGSNAKLKCPVDRHGAHSNHGCVVGFDLPARTLPEPHPFDDSSPVAGVAHARGQPESGTDLHDVLEERKKRSIQCLPLHHKCEILGNPLTFLWS